MPYKPGISYHGDQYLFQGISDLGKNIGGAIKEYRANQAASEAADASLKSLVPTLEELAKSGSIPQDFMEKLPDLAKFSSLSLPKKQAMLGQVMSSVTLLTADARRKEEAKNAESLRLYREQVQRREDRLLATQEGEDKANAGFLGDLSTFRGLAPDADGNMPSPLAPEFAGQLRQPGGAAMAALARNPGVSKDLRDLMLRDIVESGRNEDGPGRYDQDPVTGYRTYSRGRSVLPSGIDPAFVSGKTVPITGANGEEIGRGLPSPRGKIEQVKTVPLSKAQEADLSMARLEFDELSKKKREIESQIAAGSKRDGWFGEEYAKKLQKVNADLDANARKQEEIRNRNKPDGGGGGGSSGNAEPAKEASVLHYNPKTKKFQNTPPES